MTALELELEAQHELNLPWQAGSGVGGRGIVIVVIEIICGRDLTQIPCGYDDPCIWNRVPIAIGGLRVVKCEIVGVGITELHVIEDIEELYAKLHCYPLRNVRFFQQCKVNLPGVESAD